MTHPPPAAALPARRPPTPAWLLLLGALGVLMLLPIGALLGLTTDLYSFTTTSTRVKATQASLVTLRNALAQYQSMYSAYPRSLVQLHAAGVLAPQGNATVDAWNVSFTYSSNPGPSPHPYILLSPGPNHQLGDGDDIDVWNLPP